METLREKVAKLKYDMVEYRWCYHDPETGMEACNNEPDETEIKLENESSYCWYKKDWCFGEKIEWEDEGETGTFIQWEIVPDFENSIDAVWELVDEIRNISSSVNEITMNILKPKNYICEKICGMYIKMKLYRLRFNP
jgi:hypothetical protein